MDGQQVVLIALSVATFVWVIPSIFVTVMVLKTKDMPKDIKLGLLKLSWQVPLLGNIVCWMKFAKIGKLRRLTGNEHRSLWAAYRASR